MEGINEQKRQTIRVTGAGETRQRAFANALSQIQEKVVSNDKFVTLQIIPEKIMPISFKKESYKERFLFLFFPRVREKFVVTFDIEILVNAINLEKVTFSEKSQQIPILEGGK